MTLLARCPGCSTAFRVTAEQLKARGGKVRCGQCQNVFDAFEALIERPAAAAVVATAPSPAPAPSPEPSPAPAAPPAATPPARAPLDFVELVRSEPAPEPPVDEQAPPAAEPMATVEATIDAAPGRVLQEAQAAGLVAARETRAVPGYSKWAERPLASPDTDFAPPPASPRWPAIVFALLLLAALGAQIIHHYRSEISARWPDTRPLLLTACARIGCEVPLPRQAELISIEGSELQVDAARGGVLALQATLKNRAAFAQALPAIELTLTDTQDRVVIRRVLSPKEYLPARADPAAEFAAGADLGVKLWLDAKDAAAAGYRLYVFHP